ncbi:1-phosphofructokinase [Halanaerobium congolense]|uniref:Tagatose-6-phosphate kinase n=1 Tax=Halanaerobium congolense TaxID=54121 RepID=A0A4R8GCX1_9FIRM|nr:1-phosphofructokinase [Halanaerobium congolense]PUU87530.1 MAG: tagatose 6-phosphate kinase [Halanaerobium sp.]TDX42945.1 fructose-1-phosphate kinase [Halanaerobium congolense]SDL03163.1 fructose-1-phosphate kinase [Halanaerobium congolense]SDN12373.1 fructose-1-phosphate kinase [Halanaerobium congolense]
MIAAITLNTSVDRRYNIKEIKKNTVQRTGDYQATAGGKGINVSRVINLLNREVTALGFIGGFSGDFIFDELEKLEIDSDFTRIKGITRSCLNIIDQNNNSIEVLENGPQITTEEKEEFLNNYQKKINKFDVIAISGSLPSGLRTDFYQKIIKIAKGNNKKVILDTSGEALLQGAAGGPYIIKPNKSEIENIVGFNINSESNLLKAAQKLQSHGANNIALTLGKEGMYYITEKEIYKVEVPKIESVNVTGSGDSLTAGLAVALAEKMNIIEMLKFANACGVANAAEKKTGFVELNKVKKYIKKIRVIKVNK